MRQEHDDDLLLRVDPEIGARGAAPGEFAGRVENVRGRRVDDHGETEPEADAFVGRFGKRRLPHGGEIAVAGEMVACHVLDGLASEKPFAVEFTLGQEHARETMVVVDGADHAATAGEERRPLVVARALGIVLQTVGGRRDVVVAGGEAIRGLGANVEAGVGMFNGVVMRSATNSSSAWPENCSTR